MIEIMSVLDSFELPDIGVIISGYNPAFNHVPSDDITQLIGPEIMVFQNDEYLPLKVLNLDISRSVIGQVNINICLGDQILLSDIQQNSPVYALQTS